MSAEPDPLPAPALRRRLHMRVDERLEGRSCGWCGVFVAYSGRGRPPSYCSKSCRNRAWEVRSAEARLQRDIAAGTVRTGPVREVIRQTVVQTRFVPAPRESAGPGEGSAVPATAQQWLAQLAELAAQLREGELGRQHWYHARLYNAMISTLARPARAHQLRPQDRKPGSRGNEVASI
ncbi:hypothetical protein [Streptosporangium sp. NPDC049644]|uniref:hypothetical protein n=1 Tax=Streptosporangium sp. NPDC049644 TaxID=3155507 RepID=UPI00342FF5FE